MAVIFLSNGQAIECRDCFISIRDRMIKAVADRFYLIPFESILYIRFRRGEKVRIAFLTGRNGRKPVKKVAK